MQNNTLIAEIMRMARNGKALPEILEFAGKEITDRLGASRCLVWLIVDDELTVANECCAPDVAPCYRDTKIQAKESTLVVLEFLSRFLDSDGAGVVCIESATDSFHQVSPTLLSLQKTADVRSCMLAQVRARGIFSGFVEIQNCDESRKWTEEECLFLEDVSLTLSMRVQNHLVETKLTNASQELTVIDEIASIFNDAEDYKAACVKALTRLASHLKFEQKQIYLYENAGEEEVLAPLIHSESSEKIGLQNEENPFVQAFHSGESKVYNYNPKKNHSPDPVFGSEFAIVLPIKSGTRKIGVIALWQVHSRILDNTLQNRRLLSAVTKLFSLGEKQGSP